MPAFAGMTRKEKTPRLRRVRNNLKHAHENVTSALADSSVSSLKLRLGGTMSAMSGSGVMPASGGKDGAWVAVTFADWRSGAAGTGGDYTRRLRHARSPRPWQRWLHLLRRRLPRQPANDRPRLEDLTRHSHGNGSRRTLKAIEIRSRSPWCGSTAWGT